MKDQVKKKEPHINFSGNNGISPANDISPATLISRAKEFLESLQNNKNKIYESNDIILKFLQLVVAGNVLLPPAAKILKNWHNALQNQNDRMVLYAIRQIGFIWQGKLIEFGMNKDSIKKSFSRLQKMGFIQSIDGCIDSRITLIFPSQKHLQQAKLKTFTEVGWVFEKIWCKSRPLRKYDRK